MSDTIDRLPAQLNKSGLSRSAHYDLRARGLWVKPIRLKQRAAGNLSSESDAIVKARAAGKSDDEIRVLVVKLEAARKEGATP